MTPQPPPQKPSVQQYQQHQPAQQTPPPQQYQQHQPAQQTPPPQQYQQPPAQYYPQPAQPPVYDPTGQQATNYQDTASDSTRSAHSGMVYLNGSASKEEVLKNEFKQMVLDRGWGLLKDSHGGQQGMELKFQNPDKPKKGDVIEFTVQIRPPQPGQQDPSGAQNTVNLVIDTLFKKGFFGKGKNNFTHWVYIDEMVDREMKPTNTLKDQVASFLSQAHITHVGQAKATTVPQPPQAQQPPPQQAPPQQQYQQPPPQQAPPQQQYQQPPPTQ